MHICITISVFARVYRLQGLGLLHSQGIGLQFLLAGVVCKTLTCCTSKALACNVEPTGGAARVEDGCRSPLPPRGSATAAPAANGQAASASLERGGATVAPAAQRVRAGPHPELSFQLWEGASAASAVVRRYVMAPLPWPSLAAADWPSLPAAASPSAASQGAASPHCCPTLTFHFILQI